MCCSTALALPFCLLLKTALMIGLRKKGLVILWLTHKTTWGYQLWSLYMIWNKSGTISKHKDYTKKKKKAATFPLFHLRGMQERTLNITCFVITLYLFFIKILHIPLADPTILLLSESKHFWCLPSQTASTCFLFSVQFTIQPSLRSLSPPSHVSAATKSSLLR